jgi:hypothetical protein
MECFWRFSSKLGWTPSVFCEKQAVRLNSLLKPGAASPEDIHKEIMGTKEADVCESTPDILELGPHRAS